MPSHVHDLVILGAGPVGATAANLAGAHGLDCVVLDRSRDVYPLPRAIHFDAEIMRIFQVAGLAPDVERQTRASTGSLHRGADGEPIRDFRVGDAVGDLGWRPHYMFFQPSLDALLRERAAERPGVDLRLGWECDSVEDDGDTVAVHVRGPGNARGTVRARYLLACDGASSTVRRALGITLDDHGFEEPWIIVDVRVPDESLGPAHMEMYCDPRRPGTYVPGPGRNRRWEFMLLSGDDQEALRRPDGIRRLIQPVTDWADVAEMEIVRSAIYRFHGLVGHEWSRGRVFLAGDAIHQTPPFYAQGMCHGIRDVRNVLWKLALVLSGRASEELLRTYQPERQPHVAAIIAAAVANGRYICELDPARAAERDREYRARMRAGTDVGSFRGVIPPLTAGVLDVAPGSTAPWPVGHLFPQPVVRRDGREVMLDELLGDEFALVTLEAPADTEAMRWFTAELGGRAVVAEPGDEALLAWFAGAGAGAAIVRPDRYVFGTAADAGATVDALIERLREGLGAGGTGRGEAVRPARGTAPAPPA